MVGRKNVDIRIQWTAMPSTLRTTDLDHISEQSQKYVF